MAIARQEAIDPALRGAAPLSSETKRRVRLADGQRKGFETAWNEYFDCYATTTYLETPLIRLEDIGYHLYLKKNINPTNPRWELPSFRQLKKILGLSQDKIQGIEGRLGEAGLLLKASGKGKGTKGENVANDYLLYEPRELADFLVDVAAGRLPGTLNEKGRRRLAELQERFTASHLPSDAVRMTTVEQPTVPGAQANAAPSFTPPPVPASPLVTRHSSAVYPVPLSGTPSFRPPVPETVTPPVPLSGAGGVRRGGTTGVTVSGTQNRPDLTDPIQQTKQQHVQGAATEPEALRPTKATERVIVADQEDVLVERGITARVAVRLRQTVPAATIARQIEIFDALRDADPDDPKLTPGRLRRQIEEDWAAPVGFISAAARAAQETAAARQEAERAAQQAATARQVAALSDERQGLLAALGLSGADQATWARVVQTGPPLPPPFRDALFHAPRGDEAAAVIFRDRAALDRATGPAHRQSRARVAARVADLCGRPGAPVHYVLYGELLRLLSTGGAAEEVEGQGPRD